MAEVLSLIYVGILETYIKSLTIYLLYES